MSLASGLIINQIGHGFGGGTDTASITTRHRAIDPVADRMKVRCTYAFLHLRAYQIYGNYAGGFASLVAMIFA